VAAGAAIQASFDTWGLAGSYDYAVYGPNGFLRRFAGAATGAGRALEATAAYDFSGGPANLVLTLHNGSRNAVTFTVTANAYRGDGPWLVQVAPGASVDVSWAVQSATAGWYDFTVTASSDAAFLRRLAGHVETGQPSISG
jgi:phospholipase C